MIPPRLVLGIHLAECWVIHGLGRNVRQEKRKRHPTETNKKVLGIWNMQVSIYYMYYWYTIIIPLYSTYIYIYYMPGWWYSYPSEKWWSSSVGMMTFPIYGKIKNVPNHKPKWLVWGLSCCEDMEDPSWLSTNYRELRPSYHQMYIYICMCGWIHVCNYMDVS